MAVAALVLACVLVLCLIGGYLKQQNDAWNAPVINAGSDSGGDSSSAGATPQPGATAEPGLPAQVKLPVERIEQNPELPNGCEITSLTMLLNYLGFSVDKLAMVEHLPRSEKFYGSDPEVEYMGDPSKASGESCGFYSFTGPIVQAAQSYLQSQGAENRYTVTDVSGIDAEGLAAYLAAGDPVLVWATIDFKDVRLSTKWTWTTASGQEFTPYVDVHCLVLTGYEGNQFYLADPLGTYDSIRQQKFMEIFEDMGSRAVVITENEAAEPTAAPESGGEQQP